MKKIFSGIMAFVLAAGMDKGDSSFVTSSARMASNAVISRNVTAYSGGGTASNGNDDAYWNTWDSTAGDYLAYDLSSVPADKRRQVIAVWYNTSTYDNIGQYVNRGAEPIDYVIEVNSAAGGSYPSGGVKGDVNTDGKFTAADVVMLQKWLLAVRDVELNNWKAGDLYEDDRISIVDLCMMKNLLLEGTSFSPVTYEAENAVCGGTNKAADDAAASGGKAVGNFSGDSDTVSFSIEVPANGAYQLIFKSKGIGGDKENNVVVDGTPVGTFRSTGDSYSEDVLRSVMLTAGRHTVTVTKSWGWINLDYLQIKQDQTISDSVYNVSNKLINSNANAETRKLFGYLCDSYGKVTLSGQVCDDGLNGAEFKSIYEVTGKYPAICGLDMMDYTPSRTALGAKGYSVDTAIDFHKSNGIVTFCWHWNAPTEYLKDGNDASGNPRWWQGFNIANTNFDIEAVMNGKDENGKVLLDRDIKEIAAQLNRLQDAGVPVLWRPLHEASGGWFWWGAKGAEPYKKLWIYLYDQLTNVYGCNNLIWVWNGQAKDWYPGDEYVDIIGEDIYAGERVYSAQNSKFSELLEYPDTNKIIALTENGTVFDIDNVVAANSRWAWFGTWCGGFITENGKFTDRYTEADILKKTYQSEYVITLDELPKLN